jgi:hypothetical protein
MDSMTEGTKDIINHTFHESPNYTEVFLNGIKFDARLSVEEDETRKTILFRPNTTIYKGDIVEANDKHYLINNTYDNDIYPTAFVDFCNEWLRWTNNNGELITYPCVVKGKTYDLNNDKFVIVSENTITISVSYNEDTKNISILQRFILNGKPFEIKGIDFLSDVAFGKGIIHMQATSSLAEVNDDLVDDVADNEGSGWGEW